MASQHAQPQRTWHPDPIEYTTARTNLSDRGRHLTAFLRACLRWLNSDPDHVLDVLSAHWPEQRARGRPIKQDSANRDEAANTVVGDKPGRRRVLPVSQRNALTRMNQ